MIYELIIIGGGPGGVAAGVYAARKKIKVALVTDSFGGQSLVSADVRNWIGTKSVSGFDLAQMLESHLRDQAGIDIFDSERVAKIEKSGEGFVVKTESGKNYEAKYILTTAGSRRRRLGIPGEDKHEGHGVAYCSICDAPLFEGEVVVVVGGGNAGLEAVVDLQPYAKKIYLLERGDFPKGDPITLDKIQKDPKFELIVNAETLEILGEEKVTGLKYKDLKTNAEKILEVGGVFVEIGILPNSEMLGDLVERDKFGDIIVDHKTQKTSLPGLWAAGDVTDVLYKQNNVSAGDAIKAVLNIYDEINKAK
ncbi:MAG: FAD-dependent oxidoreductase [Candidatus Liptonbacteria bacterium]|nr:FAD-dependent oxidoreductase [Candidatus Liptonbacteria bacterium]